MLFLEIIIPKSLYEYKFFISSLLYLFEHFFEGQIYMKVKPGRGITFLSHFPMR